MKSYKFKLFVLSTLFLTIMLLPGTAFAVTAGPFELEADTASYDEVQGTLILNEDTTITGMVEGSTLPKEVSAADDGKILTLNGNNIEITGSTGSAALDVAGGSATLSGLDLFNGEIYVLGKADVFISNSQVGTIWACAGTTTVENSTIYTLVFSGSNTTLNLKEGTQILGRLYNQEIMPCVSTLDLSSLSENAPLPVGSILFDSNVRVIVAPGIETLTALITSDVWEIRNENSVYWGEDLVGALNSDGSINFGTLQPSSWTTPDRYSKGSNTPLSLSCEVTFNPEALVYVDGIKLQNDEFSLANGSTIVSLSPHYLEQLSMGNHSLRVIFAAEGAYALNTFTIAENEAETPVNPAPVNPNNKLAATGETPYHRGLLIAGSLSLLLFFISKRNRKKLLDPFQD